MGKSRSMELAELVQANLEVVNVLASVLEDYTVRFMKSSDYTNTAGQYIAGEIEILIGVAQGYLADMQSNQDQLVHLLGMR